MEGIQSIEDFQEIEMFIPAQVTQLRTILKENHKIVIPEHCDEFLARCLRMKDGNLEKAVALTKSFYATTAAFQKWDATFLPSQNFNFYKLPMMLPMIRRDSAGRVIVVLRQGMWDSDTISFDQAIGCIWMLLHYITAKSQDAQRHGIVGIFDYSQLSMKQVMTANKWRLPQIAKILQNGVFGRIKEHHLINHPRVVSVIYSGLKPFLKEKIKRRVFFHDNPNDLFSHVDKKRLPTIVGGTLEPEECVDTDLMEDFFKQDKYYRDMMNDRFPIK